MTKNSVTIKSMRDYLLHCNWKAQRPIINRGCQNDKVASGSHQNKLTKSYILSVVASTARCTTQHCYKLLCSTVFAAFTKVVRSSGRRFIRLDSILLL